MIWRMRSGLFNRQSFLELSLLAVFAAGLLIAKLVVDSRSRILLGPGIQLIGSGLTVHLPVQRGWQGLTQWQYERDNSFVLPARLASRLSPVMDVYWMYKLNTTAHNSRQVLEELASEAGGKLQDVQDIADAWPMKYGRLSTLQDGNERYIGTVPLDFGRVLVLQVQSGAGDPALAKEVFLTLARSIRYETPAELARGVELLQKARSRQSSVEITYYTGSSGELGRRVVDPYGFVLFGGSWYLVGFCHKAQAERTFKVERMKEVSVTEQGYKIPESFDIAAYSAGHLFRPSGGEKEVRLWFSPAIARWILERSSLARRRKDGSAEMSLMAGSFAWIARWILQYGPEARILEPEEARAEVRKILAAAGRPG